MDNYKFWMIYNPQRGKPSKEHYNQNLAIAEMNRLAIQHQGESFYLLEAVGICKTADPKITFQNIVETAPQPPEAA